MKKNKIKIIGITLLFLFISLIIFKYILNKNLLNKNHRFTIGIVYKYTVNMGYSLNFVYIIKDVKYKSTYMIYKNPNNFLQKRYYVKFYPKNPKICEILLDKPVSEKVKEAPPEGWKKIPE